MPKCMDGILVALESAQVHCFYQFITSDLFWTSLHCKEIPLLWRQHLVTPIFKSGDRVTH